MCGWQAFSMFGIQGRIPNIEKPHHENVYRCCLDLFVFECVACAVAGFAVLHVLLLLSSTLFISPPLYLSAQACSYPTQGPCRNRTQAFFFPLGQAA